MDIDDGSAVHSVARAPHPRAPLTRPLVSSRRPPAPRSTMNYRALEKPALQLNELYEALELKLYGRVWTTEDLALGFVGDIGDLAKLIQANAGIRRIDDVKSKIRHELRQTVCGQSLFSRINVALIWRRSSPEISLNCRNRYPRNSTHETGAEQPMRSPGPGQVIPAFARPRTGARTRAAVTADLNRGHFHSAARTPVVSAQCRRGLG